MANATVGDFQVALPMFNGIFEAGISVGVDPSLPEELKLKIIAS